MLVNSRALQRSKGCEDTKKDCVVPNVLVLRGYTEKARVGRGNTPHIKNDGESSEPETRSRPILAAAYEATEEERRCKRFGPQVVIEQSQGEGHERAVKRWSGETFTTMIDQDTVQSERDSCRKCSRRNVCEEALARNAPREWMGT